MKRDWRDVGWWLRQEGGVVATILAIVCIGAATGVYLHRQVAGPATTEDAIVVRFASYAGKTSSRPVVTVRTRDGRTRHLRLPSLNAADHCWAGSRIRLIHRGSGLFVDPGGCVPPARPGRAGID